MNPNTVTASLTRTRSLEDLCTKGKAKKPDRRSGD